MKNPIGSCPVWWFTFIENQSFLHPHDKLLLTDLLIDTGRFPITRTGWSVRPVSVRVFSFPRAKKIPLWITITCDHHPYIHTKPSKTELNLMKPKLVGFVLVTYLVNPMDRIYRHRYPVLQKLVRVNRLLFVANIEQLALHRSGETGTQVVIWALCS